MRHLSAAVTLSALAIALLSAGVDPAAANAEDRLGVADFVGEITVTLNKQTWGQDEAIAGVVTCRVSWAPSSKHSADPMIVLPFSPSLYINEAVSIDPLSTWTWKFERELPNPIESGRTYELPFKIRLSDEFQRLSERLGKPIVVLPAGTYHIRAWLNGTTGFNVSAGIIRPEIQFESPTQTFQITATSDRVAQAPDLVMLMETVEPQTKSSLVAYYMNHGYDISRLNFPPLTGALTIQSDLSASVVPFFYMVATDQPISLSCTEPVAHDVRMTGLGAIDCSKATTYTPKDDGLNRVWRNDEGITLGWLLSTTAQPKR